MSVLTKASYEAIDARIREVVVGQEVAVERLLIGLLTGGHVLLQGMPGVAKTLLVHSLARSINLEFARVQFTIDLLPSDIVGCEILSQKGQGFRLSRGPIFTNFLLADEINRGAPKVQSALLEAMQERRVTIAGKTLDLPVPFLVVATQNPVEMAGTFELPEAQLDRFMICHRIHYPSPVVEEEIVGRSLGLGLRHEGNGAVPKTSFDSAEESPPVVEREGLREMMEGVQRVHVSPVLIKHAVALAQLTRNVPEIEVPASPRAAMALVEGGRARAFLQGRDYAILDDVLELVHDVLVHRIRPSHRALIAGRDSAAIVRDLVDQFLQDTRED